MAGFGAAGLVGFGLVWGRLVHMSGRGARRPARTWAALGSATALAAAEVAAMAGPGGLVPFAAATALGAAGSFHIDRALRDRLGTR
jgi:hypothetical protein